MMEEVGGGTVRPGSQYPMIAELPLDCIEFRSSKTTRF